MIKSPVKAIRDFCLQCVGGSPGDVRKCNVISCHLHNFRMGRNPNRKGIGGNPNFRKESKE